MYLQWRVMNTRRKEAQVTDHKEGIEPGSDAKEPTVVL
jgi:hypothetical protein